MKNFFFKKNNSVKINDILSSLNIKKHKKNYKVNDIKELESAKNDDITFFHSIKYLDKIKKTKSKLIITNNKFIKAIPKKINVIEVSNVLLSVAKVTYLFYPEALNDTFDIDAEIIKKKLISHFVIW